MTPAPDVARRKVSGVQAAPHASSSPSGPNRKRSGTYGGVSASPSPHVAARKVGRSSVGTGGFVSPTAPPSDAPAASAAKASKQRSAPQPAPKALRRNSIGGVSASPIVPNRRRSGTYAAPARTDTIQRKANTTVHHAPMARMSTGSTASGFGSSSARAGTSTHTVPTAPAHVATRRSISGSHPRPTAGGAPKMALTRSATGPSLRSQVVRKASTTPQRTSSSIKSPPMAHTRALAASFSPMRALPSSDAPLTSPVRVPKALVASPVRRSSPRVSGGWSPPSKTPPAHVRRSTSPRSPSPRLMPKSPPYPQSTPKSTPKATPRAAPTQGPAKTKKVRAGKGQKKATRTDSGATTATPVSRVSESPLATTLDLDADVDAELSVERLSSEMAAVLDELEARLMTPTQRELQLRGMGVLPPATGGTAGGDGTVRGPTPLPLARSGDAPVHADPAVDGCATDDAADSSNASCCDSETDSDHALPLCRSSSQESSAETSLGFEFETVAPAPIIKHQRNTEEVMGDDDSFDEVTWTSDEDVPEDATPVTWRVCVKGRVVDEMTYFVMCAPHGSPLRSCITRRWADARDALQESSQGEGSLGCTASASDPDTGRERTCSSPAAEAAAAAGGDTSAEALLEEATLLGSLPSDAARYDARLLSCYFDISVAVNALRHCGFDRLKAHNMLHARSTFENGVRKLVEEEASERQAMWACEHGAACDLAAYGARAKRPLRRVTFEITDEF